MLDQLALFGTWASAAHQDAVATEQAMWADINTRRRAHTCPICGETAPNLYILEISHGIRRGLLHATDPATRCNAQNLARSYLLYARSTGDSRLIAEAATRARELGLDVGAITADAHAGSEAGQ
ncbi:hypothetical protein [Corynebacterium sp. HMSC11E11]|uniref:hypothetical protein n=1 Tax=Corynebacterium sp. HMSC11E11 TaxID=1581089 RepID=UPI0008A3362C|nr:hypothetical protein [Corynebacterium sp. HMSC11E11]OFU55758.1 hypothetical protein HMPREF3121_05455 [Corynebacterium sp. HMSC11E11]